MLTVAPSVECRQTELYHSDIKVIAVISAPAFIVSKLLTFKNVDLENVGEGD